MVGVWYWTSCNSPHGPSRVHANSLECPCGITLYRVRKTYFVLIHRWSVVKETLITFIDWQQHLPFLLLIKNRGKLWLWYNAWGFTSKLCFAVDNIAIEDQLTRKRHVVIFSVSLDLQVIFWRQFRVIYITLKCSFCTWNSCGTGWANE